MSEELDPWTGNPSAPESSFAPSAATPDATNAIDASASPRSTGVSSGTATTDAASTAAPALHRKHRDWIEARGISGDLAAKLGLVTVVEFGKAWLAVPYVERGRTINHKYRLTSEKRHRMDADAPLALWNHDCLIEESDQPVVICEGEWDAMVALDLEWRAVSVPNGANSEPDDDPANAKRYEFLWRARDLLNRVKRFILATDDDAPGRALRADLIALLGADRCSFVEYPWPSKDLNEVLLEHGRDAVHKALREAKPVPVKGLYRLSDFPDPGPMPTIPLGIPGLGEMLPIALPSFTVLTGWAGQGKTSLTVAIVADKLRHGIPVCLATFETMPRPILERKLRAAILQCAESDLGSVPPSRLAEADAKIHANLTILAQMVGEDDEMDLEGALELARVAVQRDGCKLAIFDPWNEMEHKRRPGENETQYTNRALRAIKHFMRVHNVAVWVIAHPGKPGANFRPGKDIPGLLDISGSAAWANKADYGVVYTRPDKTNNVARVHVTKVRMGMPGREGSIDLEYDWRISGFRPVVAGDGA